MVLVYSDDKGLTLEMLGKGSELAEELDRMLTAVMIGDKDEGLADEYIKHGAEKVIAVKTEQERFKAEEYSRILTEIIEEGENEIVLLGADKNGKELAPRIAAKLETGCVSECTDLYIEDGDIITERTIYSGNALAVEKFNSYPGIVTVPSKLFDPLPRNEDQTGEIIEKEMDF